MDAHKNNSEMTNNLLKETVHVMKTKPEKDGTIFVFITSTKDGVDKGNVGDLANELGISQAFERRWNQPFEKPIPMRRLTKTPLPNNLYGWGYKITPDMSPIKVNQLIRNLYTLKDEYNKLKSLDLGAGVSQTDETALLDALTGALSKADMAADIPEVKQNIERYQKLLYDKMRSSDPNEVFDYLADKIESIEEFQENNASIFYRYAPANALVIKAADPLAIVAGPESVWIDKGYIVKKEYEGTKGVPISGGGNVFDAAKWVADNHWSDIAAHFKVPYNTDRYKYIRQRGKAYEVAAYGRNMGWPVPKDSTSATHAIFTNNMVEPDPAKDYHAPLPTGAAEEFRIKELPLKSASHKRKVDALYQGLIEFSKALPPKSQLDLMGTSSTADGDINKFNSLLFKVAVAEMLRKSYLEYKELKSDAEKEAFKDKIKAFAEVVVHTVKKSFKLPSSSSVYNIAAHTGKLDDEELRVGHDLMLNTAEKLYKSLKDYSQGVDLTESKEVKEKPGIEVNPNKTKNPLKDPNKELVPDKWKKDQPGPKPKAEAEDLLKEIRKAVRTIIFEDLKK